MTPDGPPLPSPETLQGWLADLERQAAAYQEMAALNRRQKDGMASDAAGALRALEQLAADKARILAGLEGPEGRLAPLVRDWTATKPLLAPAWAARIEERMLGVKAALQALIAAENELLDRIAARQAKVGEQMAAVTRSQKLPRAYGKPAGPSPGRLDETQ